VNESILDRGEHAKKERASRLNELQHRQWMLLHESYLRAELSVPHDRPVLSGVNTPSFHALRGSV
jgi:hypothetical protein